MDILYLNSFDKLIVINLDGQIKNYQGYVGF